MKYNDYEAGQTLKHKSSGQIEVIKYTGLYDVVLESGIVATCAGVWKHYNMVNSKQTIVEDK